jgi:DNA-binding transcriptional regulator GbsR (MarR family)
MFENESFSNADLKKLNKYLSKTDVLFLNRLYFWSFHRRSYGLKKEGRIWIYNTLDDWSEQLGVSNSSVRRAIKSLKDKKIIYSSYLSTNKRNRTLYYSINLDGVNEYLSKQNIAPSVHKLKVSDCKNEHMDEHMYIMDNSKQNINKSYKSKKNKIQKNPEQIVHEKPTIIQDMIKIWNEEFGSNVELSKNLARFLVAAFKTKFKSCLKEWKKYLKTIKTSVYLMSEKFKLSIWWVIKFITIDRIKAGELGVDSGKVALDKEELAERLDNHIESLEETESCKKLRCSIIEKLSLPTYLAWFTHVSFSEIEDPELKNNRKIIMKTENQFIEDWIRNNFADQCGLCF